MRSLLTATMFLLAASTSTAQDFYDPDVLRTVDLQFHDANWWQLLEQNYPSQTNILADLTLEGTTYPDVGVRIRGNTSYFGLPPNSMKVSLNIEVDFVHEDQEVLGYDSLNFNNAFTDPTFCREVAYSNFIARYIPNGRANHIVVTLNGSNWGVYCNVQQFDKTLLREHFQDEDGLRIKCANNPNGPGLRYVGSNPNNYGTYEIKDDGDLPDPIGALIDVCDAVTNGSTTSWEEIDAYFAVDPSIWTVVLENLFTDDDSYVNKGADFVTYRDPIDGRMHLLQTDGNESFTDWDWSPTLNFTQSNKPVLSHVLSVPELRQRYMAHMRTALEEFDWAQLGAELLAARDLIDAEVQADPQRLYSYQAFVDNFFTTVNLGGGGPGGGSRIGLKQFVDQREQLLESHPELSAPAPVIHEVAVSDAAPDPGDVVTITAEVEGPVVPVASVQLFYLEAPGTYAREPMKDDGLSGDGAAGDGVYGAVLPVSGGPGQTVSYYVAATSQSATKAMTFSPRLTELDPRSITYTFGSSGIRITEYMYQGDDGEFFELTNVGTQPVDLTGWSFDDQSDEPGVFDLSAAGLVAPGESVIVTELDPAAFSANWGLSGVTVLGPNDDASLGRNDQINIYDDLDQLVERLTYGDEDFPGSVRARDESAQACAGALGADDPYLWTLAEVGDPWGATEGSNGSIGSPGVYVDVACPGEGTSYCTSAPNSAGPGALMSSSGSTSLAANDFVLVSTGAIPGQPGLFFYGANQTEVPFGDGFRCVANPVYRLNPPVVADGGGTATRPIDFTSPPMGSGPGQVLAGSTWNFQLWYRDPAAGGSTFNLSDGLSVPFAP